MSKSNHPLGYAEPAGVKRGRTAVRVLRVLRRTVLFSSYWSIAVGLLGWCGWAFHIPVLTNLVPRFPASEPNSCVGYILLGVALWLHGSGWAGRKLLARWISGTLATIAAIVGLASLLEVILGWDLGTDLLLVPRASVQAWGSFRPGPMSGVTAIDFVLLGTALVHLNWKSRPRFPLSQLLSFLAEIVSIFALLGFVLTAGSSQLHVSLQDVITLCLLPVGVLCAHPEWARRTPLTGTSTSPLAEVQVPEGRFPVPSSEWPWPLRYGLAVILVAITVLLRPGPATFIPEGPHYITLYPAVMVTALIAGTGPGILATLLSSLAAYYFFLEPVHRFAVRAFPDAVGLALFCFLGIAISVITGAVIGGRQRTARIERTVRAQAALLELAHDAILVRDMESRVVFWNRGAADTYGYSAEETFGKVTYELLHTEFPIPLEEILSSIFVKHEWQGELRHVRRDGTQIAVSSRWSVLRDSSGRPAAILEINRDITESKLARAALASERQRFEAVLDSLPVMVCLLTPDYDIPFANKAFRSLFGESRGRKCYEYVFGKRAPCEFCEAFQVFQTHASHAWECSLANGRLIHTFDFPFTDTDGSPRILEMGMDVTEPRQAEHRLQRLNRTLQALSECTGALMKASDEPTMLQRVCDAVVQVAGYRMAWVGLVEHDESKSVRPVAQAGFEDGYIERAHISWANDERGRGPTGTSIRSGRIAICSDTMTDPAYSPWREEALRRGYRSSIVLPLNNDNETFGALMIYAAEANAFDTREQQLLEGLANNVTYAISSLRSNLARKEAEKALRSAALYTRSLIEASIDPMATIGTDCRISDVNHATCQATGFSREELIGTEFSAYFADPLSAHRGCLDALAGKPVQNLPLRLLHRTGTTTDVLYNASLYKDESGQCMGVLAIARDITQRKRAEEQVAAERQKFNAILDVLPPYIVLLTPDYRVAFANQEFKRRFGEDDRRHCYELLFGRTEPCENCQTYNVLTTQAPGHWEWTGPDSRSYDVYDFPFTDTDGSPLILEMGIDVTERKIAEEELKIRQAELREAQRIGRLGSWRLDLETGRVSWSEELFHIFGIDPSLPAPPYPNHSKLFAPGSWLLLTSELDKTAKTGIPYELELETVRADLTTGWMLARGEPIYDAAGTITGLRGVALDITERKRAEQALRDSEEKLRLAMASGKMGAWDLDLVTDRAWRSIEHDQIFGHQTFLPEWSSEIFFQHVAEEDRADVQRMFEAAYQTGELQFECRIRWRDNTLRWITVRGQVYYDNQKRPVRMKGIVADITERKRMDQELATLNASLDKRVRERTAELQAVFDTVPIGLVMTDDPEARHIRGNPANEAMFGVPSGGELSTGAPEGAPFTVLKNGLEVAPEDLPMQRACRGETVMGELLEIVRPDGKTVTLHSNAAPLFDEQRRPRGAVGAFVDITERKRQEEALAQSEERFRLLANCVPDQVWTCTATGECDFLNSRWVDYTGIPEKDQLGYAWLNQVHPSDRNLVMTEWKRAVEQDQPLDVEFRIRSKEGSYRWFKTRATALRGPNGKVVKWFGTNTDFHDLRQSQELLAEANKELEAFTYAVAHDLRAPLRHMHGFAEILATEAKPWLDDAAKGHLLRIQQGASRMGQMLEALLNLSHMARLEARRQHCSLKQLVEGVVAELAPDSAGRKVDWRVGELPRVDCDPLLLRHVLTNLLSNALKFTRQREVAVIEVGETEIEGQQTFFVRDNGVGFDPRYSEKLFHVFQRLHRQEDFEGTGVGLAIVQRIIHRHGGRIWAESVPDQGATFYFTLGDRKLASERSDDHRQAEVA